MSKKKEALKRSNSIKTPLNIYPYTDYRKREIYPHTDYHKQEPFWIYREAGLLKNWLMSLTKLYIMLAQQETNDITDLVQELKDLIDKLQSLLDGIDNALLALYEAETVYKADVSEMLSKINDLAGDISTIITTLHPLFNALFNCIEERLMKHDTYIENINNEINNINNEINNIYNILENMLSENITTKTLVYNSDYTFQFFNGFYLDENPTDRNYLTCEETILTTNTGEFHSKKLNISFGGNRPLRNDYVYTTTSNDGVCPLFSHGQSVAQSNILVLYLNDPYFPAALNSTQVNNCLFDMNPTHARATWNIDCGVRYDSDYKGIRINMRSIADGFNSQYYYYISQGLTDTIGFDSAGLDIDFYYSYFI